MYLIDSESAVVFNTDDLEEALGPNNSIINIYFGADIELDRGIEISSSKPTVRISGINPLDQTSTTHTLTDMDSTQDTDSIHFQASGMSNITLSNMIIHGKNSSGIPYIRQGLPSSDTIVTYDNIEYIGPKLINNASGITCLSNSNINIEYPSDTTRVEGAGDVCKLEMIGDVFIETDSNAKSVLCFYGEPSLSITEYSRTKIKSASSLMETAPLFIANDSSDAADPYIRPVSFEIQSGASMDVTTYDGLSATPLDQISSFTVYPDSVFRYIQETDSGDCDSVYLSGPLQVYEGASFYMQCDAAGTDALINFASHTASVTLDSPKSFVLYRNGANATNFQFDVPWMITGGQINYWDIATDFPEAGTMDDIPPSRWYRDGYDILFVDAVVSETITQINDHNVTEGSIIEELQIQAAQVISVGTPELILNIVVNDGHPITGITEALAYIKVSYVMESAPVEIMGEGDETGTFYVDTTTDIPAKTEVTVNSFVPFISRTQTTISQEAGALMLQDAPILVTFNMSPFSSSPLLFGRTVPGMTVAVSDSRVYSSPWKLLVSINHQPETNSGRVLDGGVIYMDENGQMTPLSQTPVAVYSGVDNGGTQATTDCSWDEDKGVLLNIREPFLNGEIYQARIIWSLETV